MTDYHQRSFILVLTFVLLFVTISTTARPTTTLYQNQPQRRSTSSSVVTSVPSDFNETRTIETAQVFTMFGGNTTELCTLVSTPTTSPNGDAAIIFSKNCTLIFTPSLTAPFTAISVTSTSETLTTIVAGQTPASTPAVSLSIFTTSTLAPSTSNPDVTPTPSTAFVNATVSPVPEATATAVNDTFPSDVTPISPSSSSPAGATAAAPTPTSDPFTSAAQSHLSSLPIFLGAFGGIAGLALLVVGFKVYNPLQRFNEMRLHSPGFMTRVKTGAATWGIKRGPPMMENDSEKLTGRLSQDTTGQILTSSSDTEGHVGWAS